MFTLPSPAKEFVMKLSTDIEAKELLEIILHNRVTRETTPYVYMLEDLITGIKYVGSRCSKGCHPKELGVKYFTTSEIVKPLFKNNPERFITKILWIGGDVVYIESEMLKLVDAKNHPMFYNLQNGDGKFNGKKAAELTVKMKVGVHARSKEQMSKDANKMVSIHKDAKTGIFKEGVADKGRETQKKLGIAAFNKENRSRGGITSGNKAKELKTGIHAFSKEKRSEVAKITHSRRYKCMECDLTGPANSIALHQKSSKHVGRVELIKDSEEWIRSFRSAKAEK